MFIISQSPTYRWPVKVRFPSDGGQIQEQTFEAVFIRQKQSDLKALLENVEDSTAKDVAQKVLVGWDNVSLDGKSKLDYSDANRDMLLDVALVARAVWEAYIESITLGKVKN